MFDFINILDKRFLLIFILLSLYNCQQESLEPLKKLEISEAQEKFLDLDSETSNINNFYQYIETDSAEILAFFNSLNYKLYLYNLESKKLISSIPFEKDGPNALGNRITYFHYAHDDSIVFHSYYKGELLVFNHKGKNKGQIPVKAESLDFEFQPKSGAGFPPVRISDFVYINTGASCNFDNSGQKQAIYKRNLVDGSSELNLKFPIEYSKEKDSYWPQELCNPYNTYNANNNIMVVSFPLSDSVLTINENGQRRAFSFSSPEFQKKNALRKNQLTGNPLDEFKHLLSYPRYGAIFYDPVRKIYLRKFYLETSRENLDKNIFKTQMKMLVANESFEILGEFDYQGGDHIFFNQKGLNEVVFNSKLQDSLKIKNVSSQ